MTFVPVPSPSPPFTTAAGRALIERMRYELVPMKSLDSAIRDLPPGASVSVTCSPARGIATTQLEVVRLIGLGHPAVPHIAARLVEDRAQVRQLAAWCRQYGIDELFVIAGDSPGAAGPYEGAIELIADLLEADPGVVAIGVAGYPDWHPLIDAGMLAEQLLAKRDLLASAGVRGWVTTQMCLDPDAILSWLRTMRVAGMDLPMHLGVPGIVERKRLLAMGTRLGVGASMRFLRKNRSMVRIAARRYDPTELIVAVARHAEALDVEAVHAFTFNSVRETREWHEVLTSPIAVVRSRRC
jgi:methylenetetrahydrofolate reductase (NADPH)